MAGLTEAVAEVVLELLRLTGNANCGLGPSRPMVSISRLIPQSQEKFFALLMNGIDAG